LSLQNFVAHAVRRKPSNGRSYGEGPRLERADLERGRSDKTEEEEMGGDESEGTIDRASIHSGRGGGCGGRVRGEAGGVVRGWGGGGGRSINARQSTMTGQPYINEIR